MSGFVYLMEMGEYHKIGSSGSPQKRREQLDVGPIPLAVIHLIESAAAANVETAFHHFFRGKRVRGEWYRLDGSDVLRFCAIARCDSAAEVAAILGEPNLRWAGRDRERQRDGRLSWAAGARKAREEKGMSLADLATAAGMSLESLAQVEQGVRPPGKTQRRRICRVLSFA